ncbi:DUF2169 family type VI secretion system accessory protein [Chondromyces apiculatus]|uniref:Proline-rich extensin-like protein n=1 Tax=Chondromyces apiculatus DSM 436 TaxID=1192034 RepID=A0A017TJ87_9BACT|nr:DUF2169 domain-containing protein [Chondromyces apiculatus]EYF08905.1 proline-rich extensin-like protein [Chondromyces apiculatus DSM 436]
MIGGGDSWPVRIGEVGDVATSHATVVWRVRGADEIRVSVIVKATLAIVPEGEMTPRDADGLASQEVHYHADSHCSLRAGSDLAPYLGQAELLVTGHAYAPPGMHTSVAGARVVVHRDGQVLLSKTISVHGDRSLDRDGRPSEPAPFQRIPLIYERAMRHPELNPIGVDPRQGAPNLLHVTDPSVPACFGPVARHWPVRRRLLGSMEPRQFEGARLEFPEGFAWEYYQVAPADQRLDFLQGTEGILLGGMHPTLPMVRSRLPGLRALACVYPDRDREGERLPLWADTLHIDTDRQTCSLVWRGNFAVSDEGALKTARIRVGVELVGHPIVFPGEAGGGPRSFNAPSEAGFSVPPPAEGMSVVEPEAAGEPEPLEENAAGAGEPEELGADALEAVDDDAVELLDDAAIEVLDGAPAEPEQEAAIPLAADGGLPGAAGGTPEEEDEDIVATRGIGFRSPVHEAPSVPSLGGPAPWPVGPAPGEPPAWTPPPVETAPVAPSPWAPPPSEAAPVAPSPWTPPAGAAPGGYPAWAPPSVTPAPSAPPAWHPPPVAPSPDPGAWSPPPAEASASPLANPDDEEDEIVTPRGNHPHGQG